MLGNVRRALVVALACVAVMSSACAPKAPAASSPPLPVVPGLAYVRLLPPLTDIGTLIGLTPQVRSVDLPYWLDDTLSLKPCIALIGELMKPFAGDPASPQIPAFLQPGSAYRGAAVTAEFAVSSSPTSRSAVVVVAVSQSPYRGEDGSVPDLMDMVRDYPCQSAVDLADMPADQYAAVKWPPTPAGPYVPMGAALPVPMSGLPDGMIGYIIDELPGQGDPVWSTTTPVGQLPATPIIATVYAEVDGYFISLEVDGGLAAPNTAIYDHAPDVVALIAETIRQNRAAVEAAESPGTCADIRAYLLGGMSTPSASGMATPSASEPTSGGNTGQVVERC